MKTVRTVLALFLLPAALAAQGVTIDGEGGVRRWHRVTLTLTGPPASEQGSPNPFLDYRFNVTFRHRGSGLGYDVAGYFAADGDAAQSSATSGDRWRAHLCPDRAGLWEYEISFRAGAGIAILDDPGAGTALAPFDGLSGSFTVGETDKSGRDLRGRGRLRYVGRSHLQFADRGWFLKVGADSPENLLACDDIDNTPNVGGHRKSWSPHLGDWQTGDPTWGGARGKGIIGAINYLASKGINSVSFLTYSHNGDDGNVYPYVAPNDRLRMDCSKLDQWEVVFEHAGHIGLVLHFKTQETENDQDMDRGALGVQRTLYYRELVARFGHHLALCWNLGEESSNTSSQRRSFARWFHEHDPYRHLIVVHTFPNAKASVYGPLLGTGSDLTGASLQSGRSAVYGDTATWVAASAKAGRPWVVSNDEQGPASKGVEPDSIDYRHDNARHEILWGNLMAGGAGIESYFGYDYPHSDLTCEDFRTRERWWDQCRHAVEFFRDNYIPFQVMGTRDECVDRGWCLAGADHFVVYLHDGGTVNLDLSEVAGTFEVHWFDPRNGGPLQRGLVTTVAGGRWQNLGMPPRAPSRDWAILVRPLGAPARAQSYGQGCPGTGGRTPTIGADGMPVLGNHAFGVRLTQGLPRAAAVFVVGPARLQIPLPGGCTLLAAGSTYAASTDAQGTARLALPVPIETGLLGEAVYVSGAVADPQGALSNIASVAGGLDLRIGY